MSGDGAVSTGPELLTRAPVQRRFCFPLQALVQASRHSLSSVASTELFSLTPFIPHLVLSGVRTCKTITTVCGPTPVQREATCHHSSLEVAYAHTSGHGLRLLAHPAPPHALAVPIVLIQLHPRHRRLYLVKTKGPVRAPDRKPRSGIKPPGEVTWRDVAT